MSGAIRLLVRPFGRLALRAGLRLGLRWLVARALSWSVRWWQRRSGDRAAAELETFTRNRLPVPLQRAVAALPAGAKVTGGSLVVAGRTGGSMVSGVRRGGRLAALPWRGARAGIGAARSLVAGIATERDERARHLRSRYLAATAGVDAATDALLDTRSTAGDLEPPDPFERVPPPVSPGRPRARRRREPHRANRVRRSYHRPAKPWD